MTAELPKARLMGPEDGEYAGKPGVLHDRFLINAAETDGPGRWRVLIRYIWALPNSLLGLAFVPTVGRATGGLEVVDGVLEIHSPFISWVLRHCIPIPGGACAITLGHVVLGRDRQALALSRTHERVHVRQYERWGPAFIPAYLVASAWGFVRGAGAYHGNPLEREAVAHERGTKARDEGDMHANAPPSAEHPECRLERSA